MHRRVVITGIGMITPVGNSVQEFWKAICEGRSAIREVSLSEEDGSAHWLVSEVKHFDRPSMLTLKEEARLDRCSQFALAASKAALEDASLIHTETVVGAEETGVIIGTGIGPIHSLEETYSEYFKNNTIRPLSIPMSMMHNSAATVSIRLGLRGITNTVSTACSSGATAISSGFVAVKQGIAKRVIAGGVDAPISLIQLKHWGALRTLSVATDDPAKAMKPFSKNRDGFVLGEGATIVILEEMNEAKSRGVEAYGEVLGFGCSSDASHITCPSPSGQVLALRRALNLAGLEPSQVDYINAHGTATKINDAVETKAVKSVFDGHSVPISSIKPVTGHMIGASSAAEFVAAVLSLTHCTLPPTINYEQPDDECDLDYITEGARRVQPEIVISNSFAFGGHNVVLVAGRVE
jgi:beta-ketoacyl-acyl-carrier-protein synthase II